MILTYFGESFIKLQVGDLVVAANPYAGGGSKKAPKFGARVVLSSLPQDPRFNAVSNAEYGGKSPFVIDGPGEYEISDIYIRGFATDIHTDKKGSLRALNTVYTILFDGITVAVAGGQRQETIDPEIMERVGSVDILVVPVGDEDFLSPEGAYKLFSLLEPHIVIPVAYEGGQAKELKTFLKEFGAAAPSPVDKFTVKQKEIERFTGEPVVLKQL